MRFQKNFASRCRRAVVNGEVVQFLARKAVEAIVLVSHKRTVRHDGRHARRRGGARLAGGRRGRRHLHARDHLVLRGRPVGEYVVGMVLAGGMRVRRGREVHRFGPGDVCAWDPSARHEGRPWRSARWQARLVVLELPDVRELVRDPEVAGGDVVLASPRVRDRRLARALPRAARGARAARRGGSSATRCCRSGCARSPDGAPARRRGPRGAIRRCGARASCWATTSRATSRSPRSPPRPGSAATA